MATDQSLSAAEPEELPGGSVDTITDPSVDFDRWYTDVVLKAELADYSGVRGCMVIRPYGYALWENIRNALDSMIQETGHENAYFPIFIPERYLLQEAEHVEGFSPQVAWVTHGGGRQLEQRLAVRPTSEAIIGSVYARYIQSYRDLPVLINQWANVVRWELRTRLFLRTMEFLWQEGHTFHATSVEAEEETARMLEVYCTLSREWLALPVLTGRKSAAEKFAGADYTLAVEAMMRDGFGLQAATSHNLGQNFTRAYAVEFTDRDNLRKHPYSTSWGMSTRIVGALVMAHGDQRGLILPPMVAPVQVVVIPIFRDSAAREQLARQLEPLLAEFKARGIRAKVDWRDQVSPGAKFAEWELKGVPLRLEFGPRDLATEQLTLVDRIDLLRRPIPIQGCVEQVAKLLLDFHHRLHKVALDFRQAHRLEASSLDQARQWLASTPNGGGFVDLCWCGSQSCEGTIDEIAAGVTCRLILEQDGEEQPCVVCATRTRIKATFARSY